MVGVLLVTVNEGETELVKLGETDGKSDGTIVELTVGRMGERVGKREGL